MQYNTTIDHIRLTDDGRGIVILDQSQLPNKTEYVELRTAEEMYGAIKTLRVRGAPVIGIFAAFAAYCLGLQIECCDYETFLKKFTGTAEYLSSSRPTAVNLSWALNRMVETVRKRPGRPPSQIIPDLLTEARAILEEDIAMCLAISEFGLSLLKDGDGILTHCNAGQIATSRYGTALGPILLGRERGMQFRVYADETRPLLQGARLTAWELQNAGVDVTLICDNMASMVMKKGYVQYCFVGCDRIAANGDTANKIGTSGVAIMAKHYGIPFYVLGPTSTIDLATPTGSEIEIELRDPDEIRLKWYSEPMAPRGVKCYNPAFDVTDNSLISGIITEKGICRAPYSESLAALLK
ncbi:MAG: S-methyl-5-thioribose-1-phosphate isomerase [Clostridiales bacterium]|jgi:methylthioribose-1-phosphate isomerase|nr:S-methyl-5-thioribose-1-phosphate isomerase [Clostridiales bacterium]